jgi:hypothetical protein
MRENISVLSTKIIQIGLVVLAFLVPIFFLPTTSEFYNFNKTVLLTVGAFFLFFVWGAKMAADQRVQMTRTPLDIPLLLLLGVYILATMFSIDPVVSFLGWHPVFFGSLPSVAAIVILYFLATTFLNSTYCLCAIRSYFSGAQHLILFWPSYCWNGLGSIQILDSRGRFEQISQFPSYYYSSHAISGLFWERGLRSL